MRARGQGGGGQPRLRVLPEPREELGQSSTGLLGQALLPKPRLPRLPRRRVGREPSLAALAAVAKSGPSPRGLALVLFRVLCRTAGDHLLHRAARAACSYFCRLIHAQPFYKHASPGG